MSDFCNYCKNVLEYEEWFSLEIQKKKFDEEIKDKYYQFCSRTCLQRAILLNIYYKTQRSKVGYELTNLP